MKKNLCIIGLFFVFFSGLAYSAAPQGGQFMAFGDYPLSFRNTYFGGFLNPASVNEYNDVTLKALFGTLSSETLIGGAVGLPSSIGSWSFYFMNFSGDNGAAGFSGMTGGAIGYTKEIAEDFNFGFNFKTFSVKNNNDSKLIFNGDLGIASSFTVEKIPVRYGFSIVNLGNQAKYGGFDSYPPMGFRIEVQPEFAILDSKNKTMPFIGVFTPIVPFGNVLTLGVEQKLLEYLKAGGGYSFELSGESYKKLGGFFLSAGYEQEFKNYTLSASYTLYPTADFDGNGKKELKNLLSVTFSFGTSDKTGPEIQIRPNNLIEKDNIIYLSPNNDGINEYLTFGLEAKDRSGLAEWKFVIEDEKGSIVYEKGVSAAREKFKMASFGNILKETRGAIYPLEIIWPCLDMNGNKMPDGKYVFKVTAKDYKGNFSMLGNPVTLKEQAVIVDTVPPKAQITIAQKEFSPNNDGNKDTLVITQKEISKEAKWDMEIRANNVPVFRKKWDGKPDENVVWDGKNEDGNPLPDGKYEYYLKAVDKAGNKFETLLTDIVIDTKSPVVKATAGDNYFSPNKDGIKDNIELIQEVSKQGDWAGEILNEKGELVKNFEWKGIPVKNFKWDGKDNQGKVLPDGKYVYRLKGVDNAGNKTDQEMAAFIIDNTPPKSNLTILDFYFSPNQDGEKDNLKIEIKDSSDEDFWKMEIINEKKEVLRSFTWNGKPPQTLQWDGMGADNKSLPDGKYSVILKSTDRAGNSLNQKIDNIVLKTSIPDIALAVKESIFSTKKDSKKNQTDIDLTINGAAESEIEILDSQSQSVLKQKLNPNSQVFNWKGELADKKIVPDGVYKVILRGKDLAGNSSFAEGEMTIFSLESQIVLVSDKKVMNPKKKEFSKIQFKTEVPEISLVEKIEVALLDREGKEIDRKEFKSKPASKDFTFDFDGKQGYSFMEDGEYSQLVSIGYVNGQTLKSNPAAFRIDTKGPEINLKIDPELFSPDADGENDILNVHAKAVDPSGIVSWKIEIEDRFKDVFKSFSGKNTISENIQWDGFSDKGILTDSAEDFFMTVTAVDGVGNLSQSERCPFSTDILVIKTDRGYKIRISNIEFDLNKATLKSNAIRILDKVAKKLQKFPEYKVKIEGHADSTGIESWNEKLSLLRAESVKAYFVKEKLEDSRFTTEGLGSRIPIFPNNSEKNRAKNRRVEFILIKK